MTQNSINVTASTGAPIKVNVTAPSSQGAVTLSQDTSAYNAEIARQWAISDKKVLQEDYSSKYYANKAKDSENSAKNYANVAETAYNNIQDSANGVLADIETARVDAVDNITTVKSESIASVEAKGDEVLSTVNEGIANIEAKGNEANALVNTGIANINTAKTEAVNAVTTTKNNAVAEINKEVTDGKKELNDIIEAGGSNINDKITNCLLEVPQNIKLELNNGVLTLKAGSVVTVPNGFEADGTTPKFDYVTVESDVSWMSSISPGIRLGFATTAAKGFAGCVKTYMYSGNTATMNSTSAVTYGRFYNTETNKIYVGNSNGGSWIEATGNSLPICIFTNDATGTVTSIDQVFNGMGYIGSTIWVDKGVKGLIPNGINEDGTLNNIEYTNSTIKTVTQSGTYNLQFALALTGIGVYYYKHDAINNYIYRTDTGARYYDRFIIGDLSTVDGKITSFQPKQPVRLVKDEELKEFEKVTLKTNQITNCITEKPKYLDWTYADGVVTLKAGSKLMYPDGFNSDGSKKFSYYTTTKDYTFGTNTSTVSSLRYLWVARNGQYLNNFGREMLYVGDTAPTLTGNYCLWYDTANNVLKNTSNKGTNWQNNQGTFPFMTTKTTANQAGVEYPQNIFDGIGIMDKCAWVADGVKGLIPNGRNENGTLQNVEFVNDTVLTTSTLYSDANSVVWIEGFGLKHSKYWGEYDIAPAVGGSNGTYYNTSTGKFYWNNGTSWVPMKILVFGNMYGATSVTSFQFKQPFRAVNYSDLQSGTSFKTVVETYKNGTSWYRIWSDGWKEQGGVVSNVGSHVTVTFLKPFSDTNYYINCNQPLEDAWSFQTFGVGTRTTTSFTVQQKSYNNDGGACDSTWYACGY